MSLLLAGSMCIFPFLQPRHLSPIRAFYDEWLALAFGLAAAGLLALTRLSTPLRITTLSCCLTFFSIALCVHAIVGQPAYPQSALLWALYGLFAAVVVVLGYELASYFGKDHACDLVAGFLLTGALLNSAAGILQIVGIPEFLDSFISRIAGIRATGNVGQANLYANYLALGQASLIYLYVRRAIRGSAAFAAALLLIVGASLAASRSSMLYAAGFALIAGFVAAQSKSRESRLLSRAAFTLAASALVAQILLPVGMNSVGFRLEGGFLRDASHDSSQPLIDHAMNLRLLAWELAARLFMNAPLLGVGPDEFAGAAFRLGIPTELSQGSIWTSPHNIIFQLLAETGFTGAALVVIGFASWLRSSALPLAKMPSPAGWWVLACVWVEFAHALLEYPLWYAHFLAVTSLVVGIGARGAIVFPRNAMRAALAISAVGGAIVLVVYLDAYIKFDLASPVSAGPSLAAEADVVRDLQVLQTLSKGILAPRVELWLYSALPLDASRLSESIAIGNRVLKLWPTHAVVARQSILLALAGRKTEAEKLFEQGLNTFSSKAESMARTVKSSPLPARQILEPLLQRRNSS